MSVEKSSGNVFKNIGFDDDDADKLFNMSMSCDLIVVGDKDWDEFMKSLSVTIKHKDRLLKLLKSKPVWENVP